MSATSRVKDPREGAEQRLIPKLCKLSQNHQNSKIRIFGKISLPSRDRVIKIQPYVVGNTLEDGRFLPQADCLYAPSIDFNGEVSFLLRRSAKTIECLQRAKQGNAQAYTALFVPPRGYLKQRSARLPARLLPEIIQLPVVVRKAMLDDAIARQQPLFDYPWMRQLPHARLIELSPRNLHSQ